MDSGVKSKILEANLAAGGTGNFSVINLNYSDSGLFGFKTYESSDKIRAVSTAMVKAMRTLKLTDEDVKFGIRRAKADLMTASDDKGL